LAIDQSENCRLVTAKTRVGT